MKSSFVLFLLMMSISFIADAQQSILQNSITVELNGLTIPQAIQKIESHSSIRFSYGHNFTNSIQKVDINFADETLENVLKSILANTNFNFRLVDDQIVLYQNSKQKSNPVKRYTINGFVEDASTGEKLISTNIYIKEKGIGSSTNVHGYYSMTLPEGRYTMEVSYVGYETQKQIIELGQNTTHNIQLNALALFQEVEIVANREVFKPSEKVQMSAIKMDVKEVKVLPAIGGEVDIMKIVQLKAGVSSGVEGSSGIYVRGGNNDQNQILIDGVPVYNPSHLFGFTSVFNEDAINSMEILKGAFPARYNGRLSSILDIRMKEGNRKKIELGGTISPIASKLYVQGPLIKDKASFLLTGRRTFLDLIMRPIIKNNRKNNGDSGSAGYFFYDLNAKFNYKISDNHHIYLSYFGANDKYDDDYSTSFEFDGTENVYSNESVIKWRNQLGAFRWNHKFGNKAYGNFILSNTRYNFGLISNDRSEIKTTSDIEESFTNLNYISDINDYSIRYNFDLVPNPSHYIRAGIYFTDHRFKPGVTAYQQQFVESSVDTILNNSLINSQEYGFFLEDEITVFDFLKLNLGFANSNYVVNGTTYRSYEPRVSGSINLRKNTALKLSYSEMNQYLHLLANSGIGLPTDLWVSTTEKIKPQSSRQYAIGLAHDFKNKYSLTLEGYYKTMENLIDYKQGASFLVANERIEEKISFGNGRSYGVELEIKKNIGKTTGWVSYTLSKTERTFPELNNGITFPFTYDKPHDFAAVVTHKLNESFQLSGNWVFASGRGITVPAQHYSANSNSSLNFNNGLYPEVVEYGNKNGYRLRNYHRLDLSVSYTKPTKWGENTLSLSLYNAYNNHNTFYIKQDYEEGEIKHKDVNFFPVIPGINYSFKFK